ncbi:MAG: hypothetical protein KC636_11300, partial [Myxococcales bacterium]|nr:hypothetical protein [Myxococcales bacterium]
DDDLPGFTHQADMPVPLDLRVDVQGFDRDAVMIRWRPDPGGDSRVRALSLRLVSKSGGEPTGSEILCVVPDTGEFQLDLPHLRALGLGGSGDLLEVAASRSDLGRFETGAFTRGEVLIEIRDHTSLRLP